MTAPRAAAQAASAAAPQAPAGTALVSRQRFADGRFIPGEPDLVALEEPLEIRVEGQTLAVVMRTPGRDRELAAGFLLSEGVIKGPRDLFDLTACVAPSGAARGNAVDAALAHPELVDLARLSRHTFTSSSCGVCSQTSIEAALRRRKPLSDPLRVSVATLLALPAALSRAQHGFKETGGLHACALFTAEGEFIAAREDVGRHNALDKLTGWALLEKRLPLAGCIVALSGRVSFEMMQKAHAAGIAMVAAISAPTSLAIDFARASGQTLAAFVRGKTFNLYAGEERILAEERPLQPGRRSKRERESPDGL